MKKVVIFDAYGTLFDVNAAARNYSKETSDINFINTWEKVSKLWRDKQRQQKLSDHQVTALGCVMESPPTLHISQSSIGTGSE